MFWYHNTEGDHYPILYLMILVWCWSGAPPSFASWCRWNTGVFWELSWAERTNSAERGGCHIRERRQSNYYSILPLPIYPNITQISRLSSAPLRCPPGIKKEEEEEERASEERARERREEEGSFFPKWLEFVYRALQKKRSKSRIELSSLASPKALGKQNIGSTEMSWQRGCSIVLVFKNRRWIMNKVLF